MASYVDELRKLQGVLRVKIRDYVNSNLLDASHKEAYGIAILVLVLVVSPIIIILVRNAVATIQVWHTHSIRNFPVNMKIITFSFHFQSKSSMIWISISPPAHTDILNRDEIVNASKNGKLKWNVKYHWVLYNAGVNFLTAFLLHIQKVLSSILNPYSGYPDVYDYFSQFLGLMAR